jgi:hypothetical protein
VEKAINENGVEGVRQYHSFLEEQLKDSVKLVR